jgi:hypothetical protein
MNNGDGLIVVGVFLLLLSGVGFGARLENSRLYDRCMRENENVIHIEATKLCTERTK